MSIQSPSDPASAAVGSPANLDARWLDHLQPGRQRILGLDVGTKTIGLALCSPDWKIVMPLQTVQRGKSWQADLQIVAKAVSDFAIHAIIVGLPRNMDGSEGPRAQSTRQIAVNLQTARPAWLQSPGLIGFWDERLSTAAATRFMIDTLDASRRQRAEIIDALAAQHILQGAMDYLNNQLATLKDQSDGRL